MRFIHAMLTLFLSISGCQKPKAKKISSAPCAVTLDGNVYSNGVPQGQALRNTLTFEAGKVMYLNDDAVYPFISYLCIDRSISWADAESKLKAEILSASEIKFFTEVLKLEK